MDNIFRIKKHILVISGNPRALAEVKKTLRDSFEIMMASSASAAVSALTSGNINAAVICPGGGELNRAELKVVCGAACANGVPVLFLAERDDEQNERDAFTEFNAADYIISRKENSGALVSRLNLRVKAGENERKLKEKEKLRAPEKVILVAEDVALNRDVVAVMLSDAQGIIVRFAENGLEAVEKFKESAEKIHLILMDIYMPVMDGFNAARAIRRSGCLSAKDIPIIALTASTAADDIAGFAGAGMNGYLEKPIDCGKLMEVVKMYI